MFKTLYLRIAIYTITAILFSVLISFPFTSIHYHFHLKASSDAKIMCMLREAREYEGVQKPKPLDTYLKHLGQINYRVMTVNKHGTKHSYGETFRKNTINQSAIKKVLNGEDYHGTKDRPYTFFIAGFFNNEADNTVGIQFKTNDGALTAFMRPDIGEAFSEFRIFLAVLITLLLIISISLVIASTYSIIRPVTALKNTTTRIMKGGFNTSIKQTRHNEIGILQSRFDTMCQNLGRVNQMRQHFTQNVSHETKTPLTRLRRLLTQLELTQNEEERQLCINEIFGITSQVSELTKELLLLSESDNASHLTFNNNVHLNTLIEDIIRRERFRTDEKDLVMLTELEDLYFRGNERLLHQAFNSLIVNAMNYAPQNSMINITLTGTNHLIIFNIENDRSIAGEDAKHIFDRFYKPSDESSSSDLGLATTRSIIHLHHGSITLTSDDKTQFIVKLFI